MKPPIKTILVILASAAALWLGYSKIIKPKFLDPRAEAKQTIARASARLDEFSQHRQERPRLHAEIQKFVDRTLGGDRETVDAKLRTRLNRLGEQMSLKNRSVNTKFGAAAPLPSNVKRKFAGDLKSEIDFYELEGRISGVANYEQVLQLIDLIEAEPWLKRIDELTLNPRDNGQQFNVTIRLTTLFLPKRAPKPEAVMAARPSNPEKYAALVNINPFRVPPAPPPAAVAAGPPQFPYGEWAVTGVAQNQNGTEIWLFNAQTKESRTLVVGQSLNDAVLVAAHGETAEFRVGEQRFMVAVGSSLNDRIPLSQ